MVAYSVYSINGTEHVKRLNNSFGKKNAKPDKHINVYRHIYIYRHMVHFTFTKKSSDDVSESQYLC